MSTTILTSVELNSTLIELNNYYDPQQAFVWLIPIIIGAVALVVTVIIIISGDSPKEEFKDKKSVDLAILGPNEAGKTTLWNFFKGRPASEIYQETDGKVALSFVASAIKWNAVKLAEPEAGPEDKINFRGYDINGNGDFMRTDWENIIKESDMIIFVFNSYKYLNNEAYQRDINQRMRFVKDTSDKQTDGKKRGIWLLGSYADKLSDRKEEWGKIIDIIKTKPYCEISHNNACVNLTNKDELMQYYQKMFNI